MESLIYYTGKLLYVALFFIYARSAGYFSSKKNVYGRNTLDIVLSILLSLTIISMAIFHQLISCCSNKEVLLFYEGGLFLEGLFFCFSGLCVVISFIISERRVLFFDILKYVARSLGKKNVFMLFISILLLVYGSFMIIAPLVFDFPVLKGRCFF